MKRTISEEEFFNLHDSGNAFLVEYGTWRHGHTATYKIVVDGEPFITTVNVHPEEGMMIYDDLDLYPAELVNVPMWRPKKT